MKKKLKKTIRKVLWNAFKLIPTNFKHKLIRYQFSVDLPEGVHAEIEYKMAETQEEREEALSLVQASYVDSKVIADDEASYRISKFNLLPTTIIFIAKYKGEVIATVSQVLDTSLGLPVDSFTEIGELRKDGKRISEISCLAISKKWRSRSSGIYFPLTTYAVLYCKDLLGVDYAVMVTRASIRHFYTALYGAFPIENKVKKYNKVSHKSSFAQILDMNNIESDLKKLYGIKKPLHRNIYYLLVKFPWRAQCDLSRRKFNIINNKHFTSMELERLFTNNPKLLEGINSEDRRNLTSIYFHENLTQVFSNEEYHYVSKRQSPRFQVNMKIKSGIKLYKVTEVSSNGFCLIGNPEEGTIDGEIYLSSDSSCQIEATKCWSYQGRSGFKFKSIPGNEWQNMIDFSEQITFRLDDVEEKSAA
ncbi:MAG: hypothetical protein ACJAS4_003346 [Bacteriovoracaceae bacterium]|jgi:hypothetical protein